MASWISLWDTTPLPFHGILSKLSIWVCPFLWVGPSLTNLPLSWDSESSQERGSYSKYDAEDPSPLVSGSQVPRVGVFLRLCLQLYTSLCIMLRFLYFFTIELLFLPKLARGDLRCSKTNLPKDMGILCFLDCS